MSELILRPSPMLADADAVVSVINRASRGRRGRDEVDAESTTGAVGLYERAGMRVPWQWNIREREA